MQKIFTEQNGYALGDAISALQKEIRRGNEYEAMYWALELVPRYEVYLWKRLLVIANEDIGIANQAVLLLVPSQRDVYFVFREEGRDGSARLVLANTILAMCRSPKSRIADHFQCVVNQDRLHGTALDVPDYALDKHTTQGKTMGRGVQHWREEGCVLEPVGDVADPYEDRAFAYWAGDFVKTSWGKRKNGGSVARTARPEQGSLL
ncbi:MAG: hypothetical protein JXA89_10215 [Anaerolineae bacterium]|nr:hypothetical protein [Anaerolineae bacterium]